MTSEIFLVLKLMCWAVAACAGITAAVFEVLDAAQNEHARTGTRRCYGEMWLEVRDIGALQLPEKVISWCIDKWQHSSRLLTIWTRETPFWAVAGFAVLMGGFPYYSWMVMENRTIRSFLFWAAMAGIYLGLGVSQFEKHRGRKGLPSSPSARILSLWLYAASYALLFVHCLRDVLFMPTGYALAILVLFLPFYAGGLTILFSTWEREYLSLRISPRLAGIKSFSGDLVFPPLVFGTCCSFPLTLLSLFIGKLASPDGWIPQTLQMLFSNVLCDGITIAATFWLLALAVEPRKKLPIPIAVVLDIIVAALLACASLYFGLVGTDHALSIGQVLRVLVALSPESSGFETGPCFWAMYTTFIPTLIYASIILMCYLAKLLVLPVAHILFKGKESEKPHHLMAALFALVAVIFGVLATGAGHMEDALSKDDTEARPRIERPIDVDRNGANVGSAGTPSPSSPESMTR